MTDPLSSGTVADITERLRFLRPTTKFKFAKDQFYMVGQVMHEAAAEIESLRRPWIPVTERLPKSGIKVLVFWKNELGNGRRTCAEYVAPRSRAADDFWDDTPDDWFDCDETGQSWVPEGWYERTETQEERMYCAINVTHWAPLPEMPA